MTEKITQTISWMQRLAVWMRTHLCRHEYLKTTEGTRVFLRCEYCQAETPGWDLSGIHPRQVFEGDPERFKCGRPVLLNALVTPKVRKPRKAKQSKVATTDAV